MTRIEFRDPIAAFGEAAIGGLEPWLSDAHLAHFAVLTIERAAAELGSEGTARAALKRGRAHCAESTLAELDAALARLGRSARIPSRMRHATAEAVPASLVAVPPELLQLVSQWRAAGSPPQAAIPWPRDIWLTDLPAHTLLLGSLPTLLDRAAIRAACAGATTDAESAERALVAVMAWGQGNRGYGRYRTSRILSAPQASERLMSAAQTLAIDGPLAAYRSLADNHDCGISGLGAAFGTKFLYFCQPSGQGTTALILDKLLSDWLLENAGLDLKSQPWSEPRYAAYLRQMHSWATELGCEPDELESCIFQAKADESGSQWGTGGVSARRQPRRPGGGDKAPLAPRPAPSLIEVRFDQAMLDIYALAGRETGYWANYFLRSVRKSGGLEAARKLLWESGTSAGFERLKAERRLDLSMEALMLRPEFRELFSEAELTRASDRLLAHGYRADQ